MILDAPAKLNLCLYLGPPRRDGLHELCSMFEPLPLADRIEVVDAAADEVVCPAVGGDNLAAAALRALRARGWDRPPLRVEIEKRIPVAAGLGGASADAAAVLRLADGELAGVGALAEELGADVPSQLHPAFCLVRGAGERLEPLPAPSEHVIALIADEGLSTAEVFAQADRMGLGRDASELEGVAARLREAAAGGASPLQYGQLLVNDLEPAAIALRPQIGETLEALRSAGAERALISGSGPSAFGLFADGGAAGAAASELGGRAFGLPVGAQ